LPEDPPKLDLTLDYKDLLKTGDPTRADALAAIVDTVRTLSTTLTALVKLLEEE